MIFRKLRFMQVGLRGMLHSESFNPRMNRIHFLYCDRDDRLTRRCTSRRPRRRQRARSSPRSWSPIVSKCGRITDGGERTTLVSILDRSAVAFQLRGHRSRRHLTSLHNPQVLNAILAHDQPLPVTRRVRRRLSLVSVVYRWCEPDHKAPVNP